LPAIEAIDPQPAPARTRRIAPKPARRSSGFRTGFAGALIAGAALALVYAYSPRITAAWPASAPVLEPYAAAIDEGRLWLDLRLQGLTRAISAEEPAPEAVVEPSPAPTVAPAVPPSSDAPLAPAAAEPDTPPSVLVEDPSAPVAPSGSEAEPAQTPEPEAGPAPEATPSAPVLPDDPDL
jgi:hypothetical protein